MHRTLYDIYTVLRLIRCANIPASYTIKLYACVTKFWVLRARHILEGILCLACAYYPLLFCMQ